METPNTTPVQWGSVAAFIAAIVAAQQVGFETVVMLALIGASTLIVVALVVADAVIRHGRAGYAASVALVDAEASQEGVPADTPPVQA